MAVIADGEPRFTQNDVIRLTEYDKLDGQDILPGFSIPVHEIFAEEE